MIKGLAACFGGLEDPRATSSECIGQLASRASLHAHEPDRVALAHHALDQHRRVDPGRAAVRLRDVAQHGRLHGTTRQPVQASLPAALKGRGRRKVKEAAEGPTSRS
jgi:hypothetical protein